MRPTTRTARALVALAVLAVTLGVLPAVAGAADEKPTDSEIGVTAKEIHIAMVADVDNALAPGLFQLGVDGAKGGSEVHQRQWRHRWPEGRARLHRLAPQPQRRPQRLHHRV